MTFELVIILTATVFGLIIINGYAAGVVAALYFWRNRQSVAKRALFAALVAGLTAAAMLSGPMLADGFNDTLPIVLGLAFTGGIAALVSLPGAFIMSRKIANHDPVGETFR